MISSSTWLLAFFSSQSDTDFDSITDKNIRRLQLLITTANNNNNNYYGHSTERINVHQIFTSTNEAIFSLPVISYSLFVWLFVSMDYAKTTELNIHKICGKMAHGPLKKRFDFGAIFDHSGNLRGWCCSNCIVLSQSPDLG